MARQRRGGFKPPELRGTLGTLLRTTLQQAGAVRDALGGRLAQGRSRIDDFRADRRRHEALAELGEIVLGLIRKGEIDLAELPEAQAIIDHLDELDADTGDAPADAIAQPRDRARFDDRDHARDDGTVSALPTPARRPGRPTKVWRPTAEPDDYAAAQPPTNPGHKALPRDVARKGGIQFDNDDDDLAEYMHPDDVPPKPGTE